MELYSLVENETTLSQAIDHLLGQKSRVIFMANENNRVIASFSEGDALRAINSKVNLSSTLNNAVHSAPFTMPIDSTDEEIRSAFKVTMHLAIPLVAPDGTLKKIVTYDELL